MSKKPRRRDETGRATRSSPKSKRPAAGDRTTDESSAGDVTAAEPDRHAEASETPSDEPEKPEIKSLPAFGFAEDLLPKEPNSPQTPTSESQAGETPAEESRAVDSDSTAGELADPERIFRFADTLENRSPRGDDSATPVCMTTWVTFDLGDEIFALPVEPVREVLRVASVTRVPHAPQPIRGVTNLRGRVIPVIDLRTRIGLKPQELSRTSRVIVVGSRDRLLGLLVDAVHQVVHLDLNLAQSPPEDVMTQQSDYITGVFHHGEQLILLLDVDRALVIQDPAEAARVASAVQPSDVSPSVRSTEGRPSGLA